MDVNHGFLVAEVGDLVGEYSHTDRLYQAYCFVRAHPEWGRALLGHLDGNIDVAEAIAIDGYKGVHDRWSDFAEALYCDLQLDVPDPLRKYIDWPTLGADLADSGRFFRVKVNGNFHVFEYIYF